MHSPWLHLHASRKNIGARPGPTTALAVGASADVLLLVLARNALQDHGRFFGNQDFNDLGMADVGLGMSASQASSLDIGIKLPV